MAASFEEVPVAATTSALLLMPQHLEPKEALEGSAPSQPGRSEVEARTHTDGHQVLLAAQPHRSDWTSEGRARQLPMKTSLMVETSPMKPSLMLPSPSLMLPSLKDSLLPSLMLPSTKPLRPSLRTLRVFDKMSCLAIISFQ